MAGDWIPVRHDLEEEPEVVRIVSAICPEAVRNLSKRQRAITLVLGALQRTWRLFDKLSDDGKLPGYGEEWLDSYVGIENWTANLQHVGWLVVEPQGLTMPRFETWLGQSAKRRLKDAQRKREQRRGIAESRPHSVHKKKDKNRTTGQKRTEQNRREDLKERNKERNPDLDLSIFPQDLQDAITSWLTYKAERRESYKPQGLKALITQITKAEKQHGSAAVVDSLELAMSSGWKGWQHGLGAKNGKPPPKSFQQQRLDGIAKTVREFGE